MPPEQDGPLGTLRSQALGLSELGYLQVIQQFQLRAAYPEVTTNLRNRVAILRCSNPRLVVLVVC